MAQQRQHCFPHKIAAILPPVIGALGVELSAILTHQCNADKVGPDKVGKFGVQEKLALISFCGLSQAFSQQGQLDRIRQARFSIGMHQLVQVISSPAFRLIIDSHPIG